MTKRTWTTAERFTEDLMGELNRKIENSKQVIKLLDEKDIDFRFVCDDNAVSGILIGEENFGDFAGLVLTFEGRIMKLTLDRRDKNYETVEEIVMEHTNANHVVATADALIMINKLGFDEGIEVDESENNDEFIAVSSPPKVEKIHNVVGDNPDF